MREDWLQPDSADIAAAVLGHTACVVAADIDAVAAVLGHTAFVVAAADDIDAAHVAAVAAAGSVDTAADAGAD